MKNLESLVRVTFFMMYSETGDTVYFVLIWHGSERKQKSLQTKRMSALSEERHLLTKAGLEFPRAVVGDCIELAQRTKYCHSLEPFPFPCWPLICVMRNQNRQLEFVTLFLGALCDPIFTFQFLHYHKYQQLWSFEITSL